MFHESPVTSHESPTAADRGIHVRAALSAAITQLEAEHVPSAGLSAELLLMHVLGKDRAWLYAHPEDALSDEQRKRYFVLVARRAAGVPAQHLTGKQEFWGLDFEVTPDVLIPRPETEHVIEVALARLGISPGEHSEKSRTAWRIADVGTGSGCIAIALAKELPGASFVATDISPAALEVAGRNAVRHGVVERIGFIECNLLDGAPSGAGHQSRPFHLIASNPPYIGRREAATLPREVCEHEPEAALFGGETGTELYAPLIAQAAALLKPGGFLVLELGYNSSEEVLRLLDLPQWSEVSVTNDLAGIPRVASARRTG